jgi:pre-rRNA-processing protein RIX1
MTYEYQSLVRELTTPTLPNFVSSCLSLVSSKSSARVLDVSYSLTETAFQSFGLLIPRHPTIFRPYNNQIKAVIRPYLASTLCDRHFVPLSLSESARCVAVLLYQTAAKNNSGEEWVKGVRALTNDLHGTVDQVYRAVVEDWESTAGYISQTVDVNQEVHGGSKSEEDLPAWNGIDAGVQRLVGMLRLLKEHFKHQTTAAVTIPVDVIVDLLTRLLSVVSATNAKGSSELLGVRLHPAIERNERDGLWAGLESIHVASLEIYLVLVNRLQHNFTSLAQRCLSQVAWVFSSHLRDEAFRSVVYQLVAKVLPLCGSSLDKSSVALLTPVIRACCKDFPVPDDGYRCRVREEGGKPPKNGSSANADTFLNNKVGSTTLVDSSGSVAHNAAMALLPFFMSDLPQEHLQGYLRATIDQTAILTHHRDAMLASVLNPFLGKNGRILPSILPHLCREFPNDPAVEALLRPRLPILRRGQTLSQEQELLEESAEVEDDPMEDVAIHNAACRDTEEEQAGTNIAAAGDDQAPERSLKETKLSVTPSIDHWGVPIENRDGVRAKINSANGKDSFHSPPLPPMEPNNAKPSHSTPAIDREDDDSDESVHLTMDLSESDDESIS